MSERHIRRLLKQLKARGDKAVVHALRGRRSNRKLDEKTRRRALDILARDVYRGFGPTLAAEYLASKHNIHVGRETVRTWMIEGKLWLKLLRHRHIQHIHHCPVLHNHTREQRVLRTCPHLRVPPENPQ